MVDYKKLYEETFEKLQNIIYNHKKQGHIIVPIEDIEDAFPELKESEDERIRKEIIRVFKSEISFTSEKTNEKYIAWLEKQAKSNLPSVNERAWLYLIADVLTWKDGIGQYLDDPRVQKLAKDLCSEYAQKLYNFPISSNSSNIENNKQEPADKNKTEAKFHEGEWVINQVGYIRQIIDIKDNCYYCNCNGKGYCTLPIEYADEYWRKWTINDAKDGDVLATDKGVFIYAKTLYSKPYACCGVDKSGVFKDYCLKNNLANSADNIHPATKEQRDTLMKAMADAGYTFDFEKKELKNIEDKPLVIDEGKDEIDKSFTKMMLKDYNRQMPKFHKGEWVVNQRGYIRQIIDIKDDHYYCLINNDGNDNCHRKLPIEYADEYWHKWTINDAKSGDVLVVDNIIFIYKRILSSHIVSYCKLINGKFEHFEDARTCCEGNAYVHPATKEQRNLLFQNMHEAGYEWDNKNKELNKIIHQKVTKLSNKKK